MDATVEKGVVPDLILACIIAIGPPYQVLSLTANWSKPLL